MAGRRAEAVYLAGAIPVRLVTNGAGVALALAAATRLDSVAIGGVLIAVLNAPSVVAAPVIGALTDAVGSPKRFMLGASVVLAAALVTAAFVGAVPLPLVILGLLAGGCVVPVFIGGLSAWVDEAMPGDHARGFAVDALSYNLAGIAGPAVVAGMSALLTATGALLALAAVMVAGGLLLQVLPIAGRGGAADPRSLARGVARATRHLVTHGPLARVVLAGAVVQLGAGMMPVVAVLVAVHRGLAESAGGLLLTAFSIGGVTGALLVAVPAITRRVAAVRPRLMMAVSFTATGVLTLLAAVSPSFALTAVALALSGLPDATGVAAMLRLRQEESPADVRAQVFVVAAGTRAVTAAIGAAVAGAVAGLDPSLLLGLVAVPWLTAAPILLARFRRPRADAAEAPTPAG
ncbi:MFS transporter [Amnibacterium kyonggiense]|uniref:MFS transporter n=1 Tax=Amnibacterium kyonggiense TaxID=595671 RepID=UPI00105DA033|nr:MFS transporter [Amnibacterium kyonggiense]